MANEAEVLDTERRFDSAVVNGDVEALDQILADDFVLIDLLGNKSSKSAFLAFLKSGQLKFDALEADDIAIRFYGSTAVVTGQTAMQARQGELSFAGVSRFTHVYVNAGGKWRMVAAQGTPVPGA